jgi:hypothetical protein
LFFLVLGVGSAVGHAAPQPGVVMPFEATALPDDVRRGIEGDVRRLLPRYGVQPLVESETASLLKAIEAAGVACTDKSEECIVRLGALAAVDIVVAGTLTQAPSGRINLELVLVDVTALQTRARAVVDVDVTTPATRLAGATQAVVGVLRPEEWRGQLKVSVQQPGATIVVDGVPRGFSPLARPLSLVPGPHDVWIGLEGFRTRHERVEVGFQKKIELKVVLTAGPSEPLPIAVPVLPTPKTKPPEPAATPAPNPKAAAEEARRPLRIAVYEPTVAGVPDRVARIVTSYLAAEIRKHERTSVLGGDELRALMQESTGSASLGGCSEEQCLSDIADALGVDIVVLVQLTASDGEVFFGVRRIDQVDQEVRGTVTERVAGDDMAALLPLIGPAVDKMFPELPLRSGERSGVEERATRVLHPPPLPSWIAASVFVAGGAGLIATGALVSSWNAALSRYAGTSKDAETPGAVVYADLLRERDETTAAASTAWIAGGVTLAVLAVGGALAPFSDWEGLATVEEAQ